MGKIIDMTGQQFGELTVLYRNKEIQKEKKSNTAYWHCLCSCGKETDVLSTSLRNGHTKSCGHLSEQTRFKILDIKSGQKYGRLTVLQKKESQKLRNSLWICQCECGNITTVTGHGLISGDTKSCGCWQAENRSICHIKDITNQRFGLLTAIKRLDRPTNKTYNWLCKCDCGNECIVPLDYLIQGSKNSCGCVKILSRGALLIKDILIKNNIQFEQEKVFNTCKMPNSFKALRFDFYLPDYNTIIEFDGQQHFHFTSGWYSTLEEYINACKRDDYKNNWCKENNIILKRIAYTDIKLITLENLMSDKFIMKEDYYEKNFREIY